MKSNKGNIVRWQDVALLSVAILLSISGFFKLIPGLDSVWSQRILGIGLFLAVLFHLRLLLRKYHAGYSWYGILIRMGVLPGEVVRFEDIEDIQLKKALLQIDLEDRDKVVLDLNEQEPDLNIIHESAIAK